MGQLFILNTHVVDTCNDMREEVVEAGTITTFQDIDTGIWMGKV